MAHPVGGSFDFDAVITHLFKQDLEVTGNSDNIPSGQTVFMQQEMMGWQAGYYAKRGAHTLPFKSYPDELDRGADAVLFHERVHYWQMIACPLQQYKFIAHLDQLRSQLIKCGGNANVIAGGTTGILERDDLENTIRHFEASFAEYDMMLTREDLATHNFPEVFKKVRAAGQDEIMQTTGDYAYLPSYQMFLLFPYTATEDFPGYGAMLPFKGHDKLVIIPFTGKFLMESAAYLSQLLYENKPAPKPANLDSYNDRLYLGVFEYWRRLHGHRYDNEEDLILSFLAAVDLAISSDATDVAELDGEYKLEMYNMSYRFGKLAFRMQGIPPLKQENGEEPASAVARFQRRFCEYTGWPSPEFSNKKMAIALTRALLISHRTPEPLSPEDHELLVRMFQKSTTEQAREFDDFRQVWRIFETKIGMPVGQAILGIMLNASIYRIEHPGEFALPHLYAEKLKHSFPIPVFLFKGEYYMDKIKSLAYTPPFPFQVNETEAAFDVVSLLTMKPLKKARPMHCGFLDEYLDCWFIKCGFGCPLTGLSPEEEQVRARVDLDDWCHFTYQSVWQRTAPQHIIEKWQAIWKNSAPS